MNLGQFQFQKSSLKAATDKTTDYIMVYKIQFSSSLSILSVPDQPREAGRHGGYDIDIHYPPSHINGYDGKS